MDARVSEWLNLAFRWIHVVAGVMWIGHLWFFNFVNAQFAKAYDAESKKKLLPELMPRALYWFRWGAAYTFISGILLLGIVYYQGGLMAAPGGSPLGSTDWAYAGVGLGLLVVAFLIYDVMWKALAKKEMVATAISFVLVVGIAFGLEMLFSGRAMFIHIGAMFGTIMAANVWMRIWPAQRKIIAGVKGTAPAPDAAVPAMAGLRSKHNTYMSMPLMFLMVSNHFPTVYGFDMAVGGKSMPMGWVWVAGFVALGWIWTKLMYQKSAQPAPAAF
ncbi:MAG TPA: urate hydroxylase PuuD [Myxococcaceae bacterium]|nr:urate hydroxylase PuuD [Myxococcaceae bacterium]